jgi:hypothetical protein
MAGVALGGEVWEVGYWVVRYGRGVRVVGYSWWVWLVGMAGVVLGGEVWEVG